MEEYIDIVTKEGKPTDRSAVKSEIHSKGYYHNTVHIWFYNRAAQILLQQRAATKSIYPLLWDVSVAGHIDAGETLTQGAVREIREEIGLTVTESDLYKIGVFESFQSYPNGIIDNEFHNTFICELTVSIDVLTPQASEVEALKLVSFDDYKSLLENSEHNSHFVATNLDYYQYVIESINKQIQKFEH